MSVTTIIQKMPVKQKQAGRGLIGFFALMLILTLFSRGLDAYSIPIVTTTSIRSRTIGQQVKIQGTIEPLAQVAVSVPAGYLVESLLVEEGSIVEEGDILATLSMTALEEMLENAKRELEIAQLTAASQQLYAQMQTVDPVEQAQIVLERAEQDLERVKEEGERAVNRAGSDYSAARRERNIMRDGGADDEELEAIQGDIRQLERALEDAKTAAEHSEQESLRAIENARRDLEAANLEKQNNSSKDALNRQERYLSSQIAQLEMTVKEKTVMELEDLLVAQGKVFAPQAGVVMKLNISAGSLTGGEGILLLSDASQGSIFKGWVEDKGGLLLSRGDTGELTVGSNTSFDASISAIVSPKEKGDGYDISAYLPDKVLEPGLTGNLVVEKISEQYHQVVPLSALHFKSGTNQVGYVYTLREKNTTLGTQLTVEQVEVRILEQNGQYAAIQGAFEPEAQVVSFSSRSLTHGDRVRVGDAEK